MRQFDLDEYLKDTTQKVVTREGKSVRIICTDVLDIIFPIIALVLEDGEEYAKSFKKDGVYNRRDTPSPNDLFFADKETYRPYKDAKEVLDAITAHGQYVKDGDTYRLLKKFTLMEDGSIRYKFSGMRDVAYIEWKQLYNRLTWADGTPFGVLEEE